MSDFSQRLRAARIEKGLTQDELAKKMNVSKSTISMWENGNRIPSIEIIFPLSKALGFSPGYFTGGAVRITESGKAVPGSSFQDILFNESNELVDVPTPEDEMELSLLNRYRALNPDGQARLLDYAEDLYASGRYKKHDYVSEEA